MSARARRGPIGYPPLPAPQDPTLTEPTTRIPLADEIRAARAALDRAQRAVLDLASIDAAIRSSAIDPEWAAGFPARWPEFAVVPSDRTMLLALRGALAPLAASLTTSANQMRHLQLEQQSVLAAPEMAAVRAELDAGLAELSRLSSLRSPLLGLRSALPPLLAVVGSAWADLESAPPSRAAAILGALSGSLEAVLGALGLEAVEGWPLPAGPIPDREAVEARRAALGTLRDSLEGRLAGARATLVELDTAYHTLNARLLDRMG